MESTIQEVEQPPIETCRQKEVERSPESVNEQVLGDLSREPNNPRNFSSSEHVSPLNAEFFAMMFEDYCSTIFAWD